MTKKISITIAVLILIGGYLISVLMGKNGQPIKRKQPQGFTNAPEIVRVTKSENRVKFTLSGEIQARNQVQLFTEVTGKLLEESDNFRTGNHFKKGETLLKVNSDEFRNNLLSQKSTLMNQISQLLPDLKIDFPEQADKWKDYLNNFEIDKSLKPLPKINSEKEKYFITSRNIYTQYYNIKSSETRLNKYSIEAPFDGTITNSNIKPGTLVRAGQLIGEFTGNRTYEAELFADLDQIQYIRTGQKVKIQSDNQNLETTGRVTRISSAIDKKSQTIKLYVLIEDDRFLDGMFAHVYFASQPIANSFCIPQSALFDKNQIWTIENEQYRKRSPRILNCENEQVLITGLKNGTKIVIKPNSNLYEGKPLSPVKPRPSEINDLQNKQSKPNHKRG